MRRPALQPPLSAALLLFAMAAPAWPWGDNGHRIVGHLAHERLSPAARDAVRQIAGDRPLAMLGTWADYVRAEEGWDFASPWHYVTVHLGEEVGDAVRPDPLVAASGEVARPDHIVEAIVYLSAVLRGEAAVRDDFARLLDSRRAGRYAGSLELTALAFLVHLVGDLHQPMHVGFGGDRGGNQVSVEFFGETSNLHSVWDSGLIEREKLSYTEFASFLEAETLPAIDDDGGLDAAAWARESYAYRARVYEIWDRTDRTTGLPEISYDYSHDQIPLVRERLALGGLRLAGLLNDIFE